MMASAPNRWVRRHATHRELFGYAMAEAELVERLGRMSVVDVLSATSRLSCLIESGQSDSRELQTQAMRRLGLTRELHRELEALMDADGGPHVLFFSQQLVHLARLSLLHCDDRPADAFGGGTLAGDYLRCLFGVTDRFESDLDEGDRAALIGLVARQAGLYHQPELLYVWGRYAELFLNVWPQVIEAEERFDADRAFEEYVGMGLADFITTGFAVYGRFANFASGETPENEFALVPGQYFSKTALEDRRWRPFFEQSAATVGELRTMLRQEDAKYGRTTSRSHTFDLKPLIDLGNGAYIPISFASLVRKITEGPYWIVVAGAQRDGRRLEDVTGPFGLVFERFVQDSVERIAGLDSEPGRFYREFEYGPRKARKRNSDASLIYEEEAIFFEVVAGRPRVATVTRGTQSAFNQDVAQLVLKKARQLDRCVRSLKNGVLTYDDWGAAQVKSIWPVLVMPEDFPSLPPATIEIERQIKERGYLRNSGRLAIIDADDLAIIEALVERGFSVLELVRGWRRQAPDLPFVNFVDQLRDERKDELGHASWHTASFAQLSLRVRDGLFRGRALGS